MKFKHSKCLFVSFVRFFCYSLVSLFFFFFYFRLLFCLPFFSAFCLFISLLFCYASASPTFSSSSLFLIFFSVFFFSTSSLLHIYFLKCFSSAFCLFFLQSSVLRFYVFIYYHTYLPISSSSVTPFTKYLFINY